MLEYRILSVDRLLPSTYNPRKVLDSHSSAYRKLKASLTEFGLVEPLVWNETSGRVVGGHARLRILKELGHTEIPVSVVRLSDAREKALNIVLNNAEAQGKYDLVKLAHLLGELENLPELELTGFDANTLATLKLDAPQEPAEPETESNMDRVEITLVTTTKCYEVLAPQLDAIIGEFDLVAHIRHGS